MARNSSAAASGTSKAKAKSNGSAKQAESKHKPAFGTKFVPAEIGFTNGDEHAWLHYHTDPLAFIGRDTESLYDVWQVDPVQGQLTRVIMASDCPLSSLDHFYQGDDIAFVTPHMQHEWVEHFLACLYRMGECLKDYRNYTKAGDKPPLRQPVMHALKSKGGVS